MSAEEDKKPQDTNPEAEQATEAPAQEQAAPDFMSVQDIQKQAQAAAEEMAKQADGEPLESGDAAEVDDAFVSQADLDAANQRADENWDKYVRLQAEMDNLTRRKDKQVEDAHKFAVQKFVENLLPVVDSVEMGLQAEGDLDSIREGMNLTLKQFESVMEKFDIEQIDPTGEKFNPELHQAMSMQPNPDFETNDVTMVMQKGYTLKGRLVRPAMVMVCKN